MNLCSHQASHHDKITTFFYFGLYYYLVYLYDISYIPCPQLAKLDITQTHNPKAKTEIKDLKFGHVFSDHMLEVEWTAEAGWHTPEIRPYGNLSISPAASSLHYGLQCFEGMKAYLDKAGKIRLFRPEMNMKRMNSSAERLMLPRIDEDVALELIKSLVKLDKSWIPNARGYSLYLRPTLISSNAALGVAPTNQAKFFVITSPVGPYYPTGFAPVKLLADPQYVRAWPGGTGSVKCGGNYASGMAPTAEAAKKGYQQLLWLFGEEHYCTEVGAMNQFWFWKNAEDGVDELVTAPLDGTILPGVTRDSVIQLAKSWGIRVVERPYTIFEVIDACESGRMIEAFGSGTAAIVSPVKAISFNDKEYAIPLVKEDPTATVGLLTGKIADTILGIQYGDIPHEWSVVID